MSDLIARLEKASEGSRELDGLIAEAIGEKVIWMPLSGPTFDKNGADVWRYTTSVDAALLLAPEGAEYEISTIYGFAQVRVGLNFHDRAPGESVRRDENVPLAICAAALRAREASEAP